MPLTDEAEVRGKGEQSNLSGWIGLTAAPICSNHIKRLSRYSDVVSTKFTLSCTSVCLNNLQLRMKKNDVASNKAMCFTNLENGIKNFTWRVQKHFCYEINTGFCLNPQPCRLDMISMKYAILSANNPHQLLLTCECIREHRVSTSIKIVATTLQATQM